jgi:hypothetical protein
VRQAFFLAEPIWVAKSCRSEAIFAIEGVKGAAKAAIDAGTRFA